MLGNDVDISSSHTISYNSTFFRRLTASCASTLSPAPKCWPYKSADLCLGFQSRGRRRRVKDLGAIWIIIFENIENKMNENFNELTSKLKRQFLCGYPLHCFHWKELDAEFSWDQQEELIRNTANHPMNQTQPVKLSYQLNFLKKLLALLEKNCGEVHDIVYESLCAVQDKIAQDTTERYAYKNYILENFNATLSLKESKSFVADGTTGLCSWQASLALADYLLHNRDLLTNKTILELGAGTGLCGFILLKCCQIKELLLTDGSPECIDLMKLNLKRNFPDLVETQDGLFSWENKHLKTFPLLWNEISSIATIKESQADLVLAADVVYDDSFFEDLVKAIDYVFQIKSDNVTMLLAATVRNEHTLMTFFKLLDRHHFKYEERMVIPQQDSNLYWDRTTPVKIFAIHRQP